MDLSEYMDRLETRRPLGTPSEASIKKFYSAYIALFAVGCVYFASTNDDFYDSKEYRDQGGDGTQNWWYVKAEREEVVARQKLLEQRREETDPSQTLEGAGDGTETDPV